MADVKGLGGLDGLGAASLADTKLAAAAQRVNTLQKSPQTEDAKMRDAATQFEALLLQQMFGAMWQAVPKDGVLGASREEELFQDMFREALAGEAAKTQSIGIKDVILKEMQQEKGRPQGPAPASKEEQG